MDEKEFRRILASLDGTPESVVSLLSGVSKEDLAKYGGVPCKCSQDLRQAEAYIRELETTIRELREQLAF